MLKEKRDVCFGEMDERLNETVVCIYKAEAVVGTMEFDGRPLIGLDHNALEFCWNAGACFAIP